MDSVEIAHLLYRSGAVQFRDVKAGEKPFPHLGTFRAVPGQPGCPLWLSATSREKEALKPEDLSAIGDACGRQILYRRASTLYGQYITGLTPLSNPLVEAIIASSIPAASDLVLLSTPQCKQTDQYPLTRYVEGDYYSGMEVIVVGGVLMQTPGLIELVNALRFSGLVVKDCFFLVDVLPSWQQALEGAELRVTSAFKLWYLLLLLEDEGLISSEMAAQVRDYWDMRYGACMPRRQPK